MMSRVPDRQGGSRRLDDVVAAQAELTRSQARGLILAGRVRVDGEPRTKAGANVRAGAEVVVDSPARYVSRGGEKLEGALAAFAFDPAGLDALDIGASTGGFTDCLLAHGARAVTSLDVGYGQLAWRLRSDPRVTVLDRVNVRQLAPDQVAPAPSLVTADLSFISLTLVLPVLANCASPDADFVLLVKPQFEVGKGRVGAGGVVRDPELRAAAVTRVASAAADAGLGVAGITASSLPGPAGNVEYFLWLRRGAPPLDLTRLDQAIAEGPE